jgi:hypothetical protein
MGAFFTLIIAAGAVSAPAATQSQDKYAAWPDGVAVVLRVPTAQGGMHFCSREAPRGVSGFWKVADEALPAIDRALLAHLRASGLTKRLMLPIAKYQRQYLGFLRDEERFIYVNAFPARLLGAVAKSGEEMPRICDGGTITWGIEYDVKKRHFFGFAPNF